MPARPPRRFDSRVEACGVAGCIPLAIGAGVMLHSHLGDYPHRRQSVHLTTSKPFSKRLIARVALLVVIEAERDVDSVLLIAEASERNFL